MKLKYDWDDITIVPANVSQIESRTQIDILENGFLPLMTAPMDRVISPMNADVFVKNNIQLCFPRNVNAYEIYPDAFFSFGIEELEQAIVDNTPLPKKVLIDVANGNMQRVIDLGKNIKAMYDVVLMVGNIANPETYRIYCESGFDYARCGIGGGSACFVEGTKVITQECIKNIEDVNNGDFVLTHTTEYKKVISKISLTTDSDLIEVNGTISTLDHEYYILNKEYVDLVDDNNIHNYCEWIPAYKLNNKIHLLIEICEG